MHLTTLAMTALLAWSGGMWWAIHSQRRGWIDGVGAALILWPAVRVLVRLPLTLPLLTQPTIIEPLSIQAMASIPLTSVERNLVPAALGLFILVARRTLAPPPMGKARFAWGIVPLALGGEGLVLWISLGPGAFLNTGSTLNAFALAPAWLALAIAVIPAVAEEVAYRAGLLSLLQRILPFWWANGVQALIFGAAHAGWGDLQRVLAPLSLGLFQGWLFRRNGLLPAISLHAALNLAFVALTPTAHQAIVLAVAGALGVIGLTQVGIVARSFRGRDVV